MILKSHTKVERSDANFSITDPKTVGSPIIDLNQLETLQEYDRATVRIKALKVNEPQVVSTGKTKQEVTIADATGKSMLTLWESDINKLSEATSYQLNRMEIHFYLGKYSLTYPRNGASVDIISDVEHETGGESSDEENEMEAVSVVAVHQLESQYTCINCKKSINCEKGLATCISCGTVQKATNKKLTAKQTEMGTAYTTLRAYTDVLVKIAQTDDPKAEDLLLSPKF